MSSLSSPPVLSCYCQVTEAAIFALAKDMDDSTMYQPLTKGINSSTNHAHTSLESRSLESPTAHAGTAVSGGESVHSDEALQGEEAGQQYDLRGKTISEVEMCCSSDGASAGKGSGGGPGRKTVSFWVRRTFRKSTPFASNQRLSKTSFLFGGQGMIGTDTRYLIFVRCLRQ